MIVLALESSTSSAKALLFDTDAGVLASKSRAYPACICADGVTDTKAVSAMTIRLGAELARGREIAAVALCQTWHNIALCDRGVADPDKTYSWNFMAPSAQCAAMRRDEARTQELYQRTGCVPHVTYPRQSLLYLKSQGVDLTGKQLISQGAYTFYLLTDRYLETASAMSGSGLLNIHELRYDSYVLKLLGISPEQLGDLGGYEDVCPLSAAGAARLGIGAGIPVVPAYPDGALNQIASCAAQVGRMTLSVGTSAAIRMTTDGPRLPPRHPLWCYYGVTGWMSGAATAGAGNCINWFLQTCQQGRWDFQDFEEMENESRDLPVFLPFLFGERCPGWHDDRRGGFVNVTPHHTAGELYRGMQAGILFNLYQCYEAMCAVSGTPEEILVSGGILNSPKWTQMLADIFGREIACVPTANASTMGAVILAMRAAGVLDDVREFRSDYERASRVTPQQSAAADYRALYQAYLHFYQTVH